MNGSKILLVEDDIISAKALELRLQKAGYEIIGTALTGEEAVDIVHTRLPNPASLPDMVLMDIYLRGAMDGIQAATQIRAEKDIPIIYLTAYSEDETVQRALATEPYGYLLKPIDHRELIIAIEAALYKHHTTHKLLETESNLLESDRRLREMLEKVRLMAVSLNDHGQITFCNDHLLRLTGWQRDEILGKNWFEIFIPAHALIREIFAKGIVEQEMPTHYENEILTRHGRLLWISWNNILLYDTKENVVGTISIGEDVTEIRQRQRQQEAIVSISSALRGAEQSAQMYLAIVDQLQMLLGADMAALALKSPRGAYLIEAISDGYESLKGQDIFDYGNIPLQVVESKQSYAGKDGLKDIPAPRNFYTIVPLLVRDEVTGLLAVGRQHAFTENDVQVVTATVDLVSNAIQRAKMHEQTAQNLKRLSSLHKIDQTINAIMDLRVTFDTLLEEALNELEIDAADIYLVDSLQKVFEFTAGRGFHSYQSQRYRLHLDQDILGNIFLKRQRLIIPDLQKSPLPIVRSNMFTDEGFVFYCAVPLIAKGVVHGILETFARQPLKVGSEWLEYLNVLAGQAALAVDNHQLFVSLQRSNIDLMMAYDVTLEGWAKTLELRDNETGGHSQRVTELTLEIAHNMRIPNDQLVHIRRGAILHDIGKLGIPDAILNKAGPLTDQEWIIMRKHPMLAYELLSEIAFLRPAIDIPYCHHEHWDGNGYPRKLKADDIPLSARIFAVVDVWDALTSQRPYRDAWKQVEALEYIRSRAGKQFDPKVVGIFLQIRNLY